MSDELWEMGKREEVEQLARLLTRELKRGNKQMPTFEKTGKKVPWPVDALRTNDR